MANNKNFILQNPVYAKKSTRFNLGTITSGSVDLSSGNYFYKQLDANTTFSFSNPASVQKFRLDLLGYSNGTAYDIANTTALTSFALPSVDIDPYGITIKPDGTKIYIVNTGAGSSNQNIYQYGLSVPYDASTMTLEKISATFAGELSTILHCNFNSDGTKLYVANLGGYAEYSLNTAWDVGSRTLDTEITTTEGAYTLRFNTDGTKLFLNLADTGDDIIREIPLSTAYDISTGGTATDFDYSATTTDAFHFDFNNDGTKFYLLDINSPNYYVYEFACTTAFDISTASYNSVSGSASEGVNPRGISFSSDGKYLYVVGRQDHIVDQYHFGSASSITWPTVTWSDFTTPASPSIFQRASYSFVTDDGGTTYHGYYLGSGFS